MTGTPKIGEIWIRSCDKDNPFEKVEAKVLNVKNGFIQYGFIFNGNPSAMGPNSTTIKTFVSIYERQRVL